MGINQFIGILIGLFMVLMGIFFIKNHSEYGSNLGINTPHARKNKENWDYAQKCAPLILIRYGLINTILNILLVIYSVWSNNFTDKLLLLEISFSLIILIITIVNIEIVIINFEKH